MDFSASTTLLLTISCCLWNTEARKVYSMLSVPNTNDLGEWGPASYCVKGYVNAFSLKVENRQLIGDNTALNGIRLYCTDGQAIESKIGPWGTWTNVQICHTGHLISFSLRVQQRTYIGDDTAANNIQFTCSNGARLIGLGMNRGVWSPWSHRCQSGGICGIRTRVQDYQGIGDDTALNDVQFFCC